MSPSPISASALRAEGAFPKLLLSSSGWTAPHSTFPQQEELLLWGSVLGPLHLSTVVVLGDTAVPCLSRVPVPIPVGEPLPNPALGTPCVLTPNLCSCLERAGQGTLQTQPHAASLPWGQHECCDQGETALRSDVLEENVLDT